MKKIHDIVKDYYDEKIRSYGATPKGVDWNSEEGQITRFRQLSKIIDKSAFSIADIGCGYGKYLDYLKGSYSNFDYTGYDLSVDMIKNATQLHRGQENFKQIDDLFDIEIVDYSVASGIFSVKMQFSQEEWLLYIYDTLEVINEKSRNGFAFNMLTSYSDDEHMKKDLYYADPLVIFDHCKRKYSKQVALLHDYGLYEFTILIRKN